MPVISRSGPVTAEALRRLRSRGSHIDLADGLEMGTPYLYLHSPDRALSQGGNLRCSSSTLSESMLICSNFSPRRFILFLYLSGSHVAEVKHSLRSFSVHYVNLSHQTVFTCLGV